MSPIALLLEDEPLIAMDLEATFDKAGFGIVTFLSCSDADTWLAIHRPAIAIVDVQLRDGSCHDVASKLHGNGIPFIVHSGERASDFKETMFARGTWVGKPSTSSDLVEIARQLIGEWA
jgi:DNA-binding response OmpR family regulator